MAKTRAGRGRRHWIGPGYVSHIGATTSVANFVQPESAAAAPRASGELASHSPKMRNTGTIASFVFDIDTYCVKGNAAHANTSAAPSQRPPKRRPTSPSPSAQRTSKMIDVRCTAGRLSHFPDQPRIQ